MQRELSSEGAFSFRFLHNAVRQILAAAAFALASPSVLAATNTFDFTTDPTTSALVVVGNNDQPWQPVGGNPDGFLALTYPQNNQHTVVIFPDMESGRLVKAFRFEADVRLGNSSSERPGHGFSVSFATENDPILRDPDNRVTFATAGAEETGSRTGFSVSFDTWQGDELPDTNDVEGIIVRVDNVTIHRVPLPVRDGTCADPNSPETGPRDPAYWDLLSGGFADARDPASWAELCWQPLVIDLDENGLLTVQWKGQTNINKLPVPYLPQPGQFILAARTSTANEHTHFDNVRVMTQPALVPVVGPVVGTSCGISVAILDTGDISPLTNSIQLRFNGTNTPITTVRQGTRTIVLADLPTLLEPGTTNSVEVSFTTSNGANVTATRQFIVPGSVTFLPTDKAPTFDAASSGFTVRPHWLGNENPRGPGNPNTAENAETQLGGRFTFLNDTVIPNQANLAGASNGVFTVPLVNFEQSDTNVTTIAFDNFNAIEPPGAPRTNQPLPGITSTNANNVAMEILTFLDLPTGCHTFGVNSDEGFVVTLGHGRFGTVLGQFPRGRRAADTLFQIIVQEAGVYPIRLAWWEGSGPASVEFFNVTETGRKILINDRLIPGHIKAYSVGTTPGYLADFGIQRPNVGPNPTSDVIATFRNGITSVDLNSIRLRIDDAQVTPTVTTNGVTTNAVTTLVYGAPGGGFPLGTTHTAELIYSIGGVARTNEFTFTIRVGGLFAEAEHFDYESGKMIPAVNTMPYFGDEYAGLGAVHNVDYHRADNSASGNIYRVGETPNVPLETNMVEIVDLQRGNLVIGENYRIRSSDEGDWYNYRRNFTNGNYFVFVAQSSNEPENTPDRQRVRLTRLAIDGTNQTEIVIGSYQRPSSGDAATSTLNQVMNGPIPAVVHLSGTNTIRVYVQEGDFDWLVFVPTLEGASAPNFVIEAEDFNFNGGETLDIASVMPLTTAPFAGLGAVAGIDYQLITLSTNAATDLYRTNESPNVPILENNERGQNDRGLWIRTNNYRITEIDPGEWFNYTRTFPTGTYNIYAALSHGGTNETNRTSGSLQRLTGDTNTTNQIVELGEFDEPGPTGAWGANRLVPLRVGGELARVTLSGTNTLRYTGRSGEFDYLVIVPATRPTIPPTDQPRITSITRNGNQVTVTWIGGGVLEIANQLGPNAAWTPVQGQGNGTAIVTLGPGPVFFRVRLDEVPVEQPQITSITRSGNQITVTWIGGGVLETSPQLGTNAVWTAVQGQGGGTATFTIGPGNLFFRVRTTGTTTPTEPEITAITRTGSQLTITWTGGGTLESSGQLGPAAAWAPVSGAGAGTATIPVSPGNRFFRVRR
jgi:hypothetical protein